ncbi:hypothetical protein RND71_036333 [Anisodus tanguticus]|uniref:Uncharacterized protein n=1 Tax=Anisodus tanguticus TaxID=243964 RepID=A0AAE1UZQ3_9SOLA|nr:hypothetical protein RND71_036333 [Anisodus tanguticus]
MHLVNDVRIIQLWNTYKVLGKLKYINLSHSQNLVRTPDFSGTPNLERLVLEECTSLVEINFSVGDLGRLVLLNLKNCRNLKTLPESIRLEKLEIFILSGCLKLKSFPEIEGKMNCLAELYLGATALSELPASIENLSGVGVINLSYCKRLESLPRSISRLKCLKTLDVSGCSKLKKLPDDLGLLIGLEELHCTDTAIRTIPSSVSLLKNLKHLSLRKCNALGLQGSSSSFFPWLQEKSHGQKFMGINFHNLSGLCSLTNLDLSDCNISNGGILCNLGFLLSLVELNLDGNNFPNIPAASISSLTRLKVLALAGCRRLEIFPELPPSIEKLYADECTSLKSIDQLTKYPMLRTVSLRKCHQLLKDKRHASILDSLWKHMLKELSMMGGRFSIYAPGVEIPEWFTHKNSGASISVALPKNWYTHDFMGFAICAGFDMKTPFILSCVNYLQTFQGLGMRCQFTCHDGSFSEVSSSFGLIGSENHLDLGHTFLGYLSFDSLWWAFEHMVYSPNNWIQFEFGASNENPVIKGLGVRLVYKNDINDPE